MNAAHRATPDQHRTPLRQRFRVLLYPALLLVNLVAVVAIFLHTQDPQHLAMGMISLAVPIAALA